jgi:hypothetical protein
MKHKDHQFATQKASDLKNIIKFSTLGKEEGWEVIWDYTPIQSCRLPYVTSH